MSGLRVVAIFNAFIFSYPFIAFQRVQITICTCGSAFHTAGERKILHSEKSKTLCSLLLQVLICMFLLSGCDSSSVSSNGNEYYIINENHFTFEDYNVLEVIVSDSEKFVLYDTEIDDYESGIGEWIKDGVSYPIAFMDYDNNHLSGKHANIIIVPNANYGIYWNTKDTDEMPPVIAMINNDTTNPGLYRWSTGAYLRNC